MDPQAIKAAAAALPGVQGRRPDSSEEELNGAFGVLQETRESGMFIAKFTGESAWERHPNGDELVQVLAGRTKVTVIAEDGPQTLEMTADMAIVVPRGAWHKFQAETEVQLMTMTAMPTEHCTVDTPPEVK